MKVFERKRTAMGRARDREKNEEACSSDSEILSRLRVPASVRRSDVKNEKQSNRVSCDARNSLDAGVGDPVVLENQSYYVSSEVSTPFSSSRVLADSRSRFVVPPTTTTSCQ